MKLEFEASSKTDADDLCSTLLCSTLLCSALLCSVRSALRLLLAALGCFFCSALFALLSGCWLPCSLSLAALLSLSLSGCQSRLCSLHWAAPLFLNFERIGSYWTNFPDEFHKQINPILEGRPTPILKHYITFYHPYFEILRISTPLFWKKVSSTPLLKWPLKSAPILKVFLGDAILNTPARKFYTRGRFYSLLYE
jgi:hypothetical protein